MRLRQTHDKSRILRLGIERKLSAMGADDTLRDAKTNAGALSTRFGREKRLENLLLNLRRDSTSRIRKVDFGRFSPIVHGDRDPRFVAAADGINCIIQ